jgi:hypothetical protein
MNIFRLAADMLHLGAILVLLYRIKNTRNCIGKYRKHNIMLPVNPLHFLAIFKKESVGNGKDTGQ